MKKLLEITPPRGIDFLHKIDHILEREKNWVSVLLNLSLSLPLWGGGGLPPYLPVKSIL